MDLEKEYECENMLCKATQWVFLLCLTLPDSVTAASETGGLCFCTRKFCISEHGVHLINDFLGCT